MMGVNEWRWQGGCFPGGGAAHLFRATESVAPVSAAPPGEMAARLAAKHQNKRPGLPTEPLFTLIWQRLSPEAVLRTFSGLQDCSPGKRSATGGDGGASGRKTQKQKAQSSD
ncbi:hypothetical protein YA25_14585 [Klebsiella aerogenes]|nr:hypothetical protein YA25_14585 [Klebsiella aerogenes]